MKLIVGLGNPGKEYENTRHNTGYMAIDRLAKLYNAQFKLDSKLKGFIATVNDLGNKFIMLKPVTYMNLSGDSVRAVVDFFKIDINDIIIISDDLDSNLGRIRIRTHGSAGGHNGLKSIISSLGTQEFKRIRIGIGRDSVIPVVDYVLSRYTNDDFAIMEQSFDKVVSACKDFIDGVEYSRIASKYCANEDINI